MSGEVIAVHAAYIRGVEAYPITVEVSLSGSVPGINIVGAADATLLEGRARIRSAFRQRDFETPRKAITVNLSPGDIRKTGSGFDLPIAIGILAASGQISREGLDSCLFVGELALTGVVLPVRGEAAYQVLAHNMGLTLVGGNSGQHVALEGVAHKFIEHLGDLTLDPSLRFRDFPSLPHVPSMAMQTLDYADVAGQEIAKRALTIAAAGNIGLLMIGAPGSGKSMLAQRMTTILPPLTPEDKREALRIHSVAGERIDALLSGVRPFRSPHHSISIAGLIGGGRPVAPGEISLAHGGVLFLDELAEFSNAVLQSLRQPIESGEVHIVRAEGSYVFPSRFQLLAASNPCPCGYLGDREVACKCSDAVVERYQSKLRGPLADRIDLIVDIARPDPDQIIEKSGGMDSKTMKASVLEAREFRSWRIERSSNADASSHKVESLANIVEHFAMDESGESSMLALSRHNHLTGRGMVRLSRIARTVADIDTSERISKKHVLEAAMYQGRRDE